MKFFPLILTAVVVIAFQPSQAQESSVRRVLLGSAYASHEGYRLLQRVCDEAGGRLAGSEANDRALGILEDELARYRIGFRRESFSMPGWVRGDDAVEVVSPFPRKLRAAALGYVHHHPPFESRLVWGGTGTEKELTGAADAIVLVDSESPRDGEPPLRYEVIDNAARAGAKGVLFVNDKPGGLVLTGVGNFQGNPCPVPAYSITLEEGKWLRRLQIAGKEVRIRLTTNSRCMPVQSANLVASFPGKRQARIVVGAHVDSWDISQGAVDNGIGSAVLFEIARLLSLHADVNHFAIDVVWFNAEELGLWGAKAYLTRHAADSIVALINMDMPGRPTGINVMGFDEFIPLVRGVMDSLKGFDWSQGIVSVPWSNSDHQPFLVQGIPCFTMAGHLEKESVFHYHDFGDTFDKADHRALVDAAAALSVLTYTLANNTSVEYRIRSVAERRAMFQGTGFEKRLKRQKEWPY
ncbi:MAG: M28 family peptidase [Bacteroidetes bacterium]|nr:M28 family peptidase [Bacteroidota bacterium]